MQLFRHTTMRHESPTAGREAMHLSCNYYHSSHFATAHFRTYRFVLAGGEKC
jgi:hypothetical protein